MKPLQQFEYVQQGGRRRSKRQSRKQRRKRGSTRKGRKARTPRVGGVKVQPSLLRLPYAQPMSPPRRPLASMSTIGAAQQLTGELPRRESYTLGNKGPLRVVHWDPSKPRRRAQARIAIGRFKEREATRRRRKAAESKWKSISKEGKSKRIKVYSDNIFKGHKTAMAKADTADEEAVEARTRRWARTGR